ncbi:hypothetical protein B5F90_08315 [Alistipes sp. An31A]|nr:hypothetical protein B5F90_08315 [Alistipes sp. An31A]
MRGRRDSLRMRGPVLPGCGGWLSSERGGLLLSAGSLGADFVRSFRQLTINYRQMFIRGR